MYLVESHILLANKRIFDADPEIFDQMAHSDKVIY